MDALLQKSQGKFGNFFFCACLEYLEGEKSKIIIIILLLEQSIKCSDPFLCVICWSAFG